MKNRFYKINGPITLMRSYKDKVSGYIIWEGLTRQEYGIPDWRVSKDIDSDYERGGTFKECKEYLIEKFPITHLALTLQGKYLINKEDEIKMVQYFKELGEGTDVNIDYTNITGLTIAKAARRTNPDFHWEEMDHMIYAITGIMGVITPEYL